MASKEGSQMEADVARSQPAEKYFNKPEKTQQPNQRGDNPGMRGLITTRHLITNARTIIHEFGWVAYVRCLAAALFRRRKVTFLECVVRLQRS